MHSLEQSGGAFLLEKETTTMNGQPTKANNRKPRKVTRGSVNHGSNTPTTDRQSQKAREDSLRRSSLDILSNHNGSGDINPKMNHLYHAIMAGLVLSFIFLLIGVAYLLAPVHVGNDGTVIAVPDKVKAGQLVSYTVNSCTENEYRGTVAVNLQSTDLPPTITVAVAAPTPQRVHCHNIILVPSALPSGTYHLVVYITYDINPVRNALSPVRHKYTSQVITVTNPNPNYTLPKAVQQSAPVTSKQKSLKSDDYPTRSADNTKTTAQGGEQSSTPQKAQSTTKPNGLIQNTTDTLNSLVMGVKGLL